MLQKKWTGKESAQLTSLLKEGKTTEEICTLIPRSASSIKNKIRRTKSTGNNANTDSTRKWTQAEMGLLYAYLENGDSYLKISDNIDRSIIAVERKAQTTDWKAWKKAVGTNDEQPTDQNQDEMVNKLIDALVTLSRQDYHRLASITEKEFRRKTNLESTLLPVSFPELRDLADKALEKVGLKNPEEMSFEEGTYIVVGDSHGKFTKNKMFNLLSQVDKFFKPNKIIHIGHLLDDDNDISYNWGKFKNLIIVSKIEELRFVQEQRNKFDFNYDIVRGGINLGNDLMVMNQDLITDYTKTPISSLDSEIFDKKCIVNCHRFELFTRCCEEGDVSYVASPGGLCEKHIIRTIKQIDFADGRVTKQANADGFSKYRRMRHLYQYWKQGIIVVNVNKDGETTIVPCIIKNTKSGYGISYFDKIITNRGVVKPSKKIFIVADSHSPNHCSDVLSIQDQVVKDYNPDVFVNLGDACDYRTLNHHQMERREVIFGNTLNDAAKTHYVLKKQSEWAKELYISHGNHERFAEDFIAQYPQLASILNFKFLCNVESLGYKTIDLKKPLKINGVVFVHGDLRLFGQSGSKLEKLSKTFGATIFMGDSHYSAIRNGTFAIGLSGNLDQEYNEAAASTWVHGFGMCNQYGGQNWPTTIMITDNKCNINEKTYIPENPESWDIDNFTAQLSFSYPK